VLRFLPPVLQPMTFGLLRLAGGVVPEVPCRTLVLTERRPSGSMAARTGEVATACLRVVGPTWTGWLHALQAEPRAGSLEGKDKDGAALIQGSTWNHQPVFVLLRIAGTDSPKRTMNERRVRNVSITNTSMRICPTKGSSR
jgi:hypothetical protein